METETLSVTRQISKVYLRTNKSGLIVCKAVNEVGSNAVVAQVSPRELEGV